MSRRDQLYVALALQQGGRLEIAATYGQPGGDLLLVASRAAGEAFTPAKRGGTCQIESLPGRGTCVSASLPLPFP